LNTEVTEEGEGLLYRRLATHADPAKKTSGHPKVA